MFLDKYLSQTYLELVYNNYDEEYLNKLDENNFNKIYTLLKNNSFYFIDDIILNYLELFELNEESVKYVLSLIKSELGNNYIQVLGNNMLLFDKIIEMTINYEKY